MPSSGILHLSSCRWLYPDAITGQSHPILQLLGAQSLGRAQLCQLSEMDYATQLGRESHSSTGEMRKSNPLSGGASDHLGSVLQDVQLAERGAGAGRGWGGEQICL